MADQGQLWSVRGGHLVQQGEVPALPPEVPEQQQDSPATPRRAPRRRPRPVVPSWEDVLRGTRSHRR